METQENEVQEQVNEEVQSQILDEEEVSELIGEEGATEEPEVTLPSEEEEVEIPDKFKGKSPEEIIKAYQELEKKLGKKEEPTEEPTKEEPEPKEENKKVNEEVEKYQKFIESYQKNGSLTDEDYAELEKMGYPRDYIDQQIEFIKYKQEEYTKKILSDVGGEEVFQEAVAWARENWSEDQIKAFNNDLAKASEVGQKAMIKALVSDYKSNAGSDDDGVMHSNKAPNRTTKGYSAEHEFLKDISDPRYGKDRSYTRAVEAKMAVTDTSSWEGFNVSVGR